MAAFTLDGETYEYFRQDPGHPPGGDPLMGVRQLNVGWADDRDHSHWARVPAGNIRRVTDSEWDIEEYRRCPAHLRGIRWGNRLPGFLPA